MPAYVVGLLDMHKMSSGLAPCKRCNAVGYTLHRIRITLFACCLTCTGCMKLTNADSELFAFAIWCMQFMMLVSSTVCALRGYSHLQNAQAVHQHHTRHVAICFPLHNICVFSRYPRTSGSASCNANSILTVITCVLACSPLESFPSFRSHTPVQISSCHPGVPQKAFSKDAINVLNNTNINTC